MEMQKFIETCEKYGNLIMDSHYLYFALKNQPYFYVEIHESDLQDGLSIENDYKKLLIDGMVFVALNYGVFNLNFVKLLKELGVFDSFTPAYYKSIS